ncbi:MAG TPA: respiratory nitrate reductase subunit gamma [bacterium]|nr:respiratory nitrate reductase subunit gamma [bacterium]
MSGATLLLWIVLPYLALAVFVVGHVWRWRHDQFGWTTRSTQLLEHRLLLWGSPLFHYGALGAIVGHVIGIVIPESWTAALGVSGETYHLFSAWAGTAAIAAVGTGLVILLYRRVAVPRVRVTTRPVDIAVYVLLLIIIGLGAAETIGVNLIGPGYDYRATVALWFRGLFAADPHPELMVTAPWLYQAHALSAWFLLGLWPFSRLVHAWSYPVLYLGRPWIVYRGYRRRTRPAPVPAVPRR